MTTAPTPSRALLALVTGVASTGYYAVPDVLASRAARGWARAACLVVVAAASVPDARAARAAWQEAQARGEQPGLPGLEDLPTAGRLLLAGAGAVTLLGALRLVVAVERWIHRRGQARAAAGRRLAHTREGLLYGALAAGLALVPPQP